MISYIKYRIKRFIWFITGKKSPTLTELVNNTIQSRVPELVNSLERNALLLKKLREKKKDLIQD